MSMRQTAPFIHNAKNDAYISVSHLLSLIPVTVVGVIFYGPRAAILILVCAAAFFASDVICARLRHAEHVRSLSSLYMGAAYALLLPPNTPLYIALTGVIFASVAVRQLSGGRGSAVINPAAAGRLFIRIVFPQNEHAFAFPGAGRSVVRSLFSSVPAFGEVNLNEYSLSEIIAGRYPSFIGTSCAFIMLLGMGYLIAKRVTRFYVPVSYLLMLIVLFWTKNFYMEPSDTLMFMLTSGVVFTAAFLLNDDETVKSFGPVSIIQAFICAALTFLLSFKTTGSDLITIPVILTGALTGIIDYFMQVLRTAREDRLHVKS